MQDCKHLAVFWTEHLRPPNPEDPHLPLNGYIRFPVADEDKESQRSSVMDVLAHGERHIQGLWSLIQQLADQYQPTTRTVTWRRNIGSFRICPSGFWTD